MRMSEIGPGKMLIYLTNYLGGTDLGHTPLRDGCTVCHFSI